MFGVLDLLVMWLVRVSLVRVTRSVGDWSALTFLASEATDLLQKLALNPTGKAPNVPGANEKVRPAYVLASSFDHCVILQFCVNWQGWSLVNLMRCSTLPLFLQSLEAPANGVVAAVVNQKPVMEWSGTPRMQDYKDATMYYGAYPAYVYGAYGGWGQYSTYLSHDGAGTPTPGAYGDMYYGYSLYDCSTSGYDGRMYGSQASQHCQYPSTYNKQHTTTGKLSYNGKTENRVPSLQGDVSTDSVKGQKKLNLLLKASQNRPGPNGSYGQPSGCFSSCQNQTNRLTYPYYDSQIFSDRQQKLPSGNRTPSASNTKSKGQSRNQNMRPYPHLMRPHTPTSPMGQPSIYSASGMYGYNGNSYGPGLWYGSHMYGSGLYGGWNALSDGKYKPRGRGNGSHVYGNENLDGLNELKRGPRSGPSKNQQGVGATAAAPVKGQELSASNGSPAAMKDHYNRADFVETYSDAKFFIIKSYSEDDVHKSIKYNVWASTTNGNKKLDTAYQEAKEKSSDSSLFLLFSVNASGQFVGLAEMVGRVDFSKTVEHWQQDKWTGCFPVKWHIVKDVPNNLLKHIILENNENKPLTNSRDTHEVNLEQGLQVLKIFKDHVYKTSILDDFAFYDNREKMMQESKAKQQQSLKKVMDAKLLNDIDTEKDMFNGKPRSHKLIEVEAGQQNDVKENSLLAVSVNGAALKDVQSPTEKLAGANGC